MTKVRLSANKAHSTSYGGVAVVFDFQEYFPTRVVEVNGTAGALAALEAYAKEAEATGQSLCVTVGLVRGERSPNGFKKAKTDRCVNLQPEA